MGVWLDFDYNAIGVDPDPTLRGVWSWSTLFAKLHFIRSWELIGFCQQYVFPISDFASLISYGLSVMRLGQQQQ